MTDGRRYLRVPMAAARVLAESSDGPELLAGYMALQRFAQTKLYDHTAAGAKAIRKTTGITDWRAKRVLSDLLALRLGQSGEQFLIEPTGNMVKNARQYRFGAWEGDVSYVSDLLLNGDPSPLSLLIKDDGAPELRRDALLMLAYCYCVVDYGDWMGVPPDLFAHVKWVAEGSRELDVAVVEFGYAGDYMGLHFWIMEEDGDIRASKACASRLYGEGDDVMERFWAAHALLMRTGLICRIVVVRDRESWPLWVGNRGYREGLAKIGVVGDLAQKSHNFAAAGDLDPDNRIISDAVSMAGGSGVYFVPSVRQFEPKVHTIFAPTYHATTPINISGLVDVATRTRQWENRLRSSRARKFA